MPDGKNRLLIYDKENNSLTRHALFFKRIDVCESHTIIYLCDDISIRLPFTLKSVTSCGSTVTIHWLNDFYSIIDYA